MRALSRGRVVPAAALAAVLLAPPAAGQTPSTVVVSAFRVHGNYRTPDAEVIRLTGLQVGDALDAAALRQAEDRLRASGQFAAVEVKERFQSLTDASHAVLVVLVTEKEVPPGGNPLVRPFKKAAHGLMFLPVLDYTEEYGFTYGGRASFVDWPGRGARVSVPLTWGGEKRAAVEIDRAFTRARLGRVSGGVAVWTRQNPHFDLDDHRVEAWARGEHELARGLTAGAEARWARVTFGGVGDRVTSAGVDLTFDTRTDPAFPRNAVLARASWRASSFRSAPRTVHTYTLEGRGYVGLIGQMVLSVRALYEGAGEPLPAFAQPLLGGAATLRGHRAGAYAGDQLATSSIELRVPLDSPMGLGRAGVKVFFDAGAVFAAGTSLRDATFHQGAGGGVFFTAPLVRFDLDVGHDLHHGARVHVTAGFSF